MPLSVEEDEPFDPVDIDLPSPPRIMLEPDRFADAIKVLAWGRGGGTVSLPWSLWPPTRESRQEIGCKMSPCFATLCSTILVRPLRVSMRNRHLQLAAVL